MFSIFFSDCSITRSQCYVVWGQNRHVHVILYCTSGRCGGFIDGGKEADSADDLSITEDSKTAFLLYSILVYVIISWKLNIFKPYRLIVLCLTLLTLNTCVSCNLYSLILTINLHLWMWLIDSFHWLIHISIEQF